MSNLKLDSTEAKASYGAGLQLGQQIRDSFPGFTIEEALAGIHDGYESKMPQISPDEINNAFPQRVIKKQSVDMTIQ